MIEACRNSGYEVFSAHEIESFGTMNVEGLHFDICQRDFNWMQKCDCFAAVLPVGEDNLAMRIDGTNVELGWASALKRPVVLVGSPNAEYSHLIKGLDVVTPVVEVSIETVRSNPMAFVETVEKALAKSEKRAVVNSELAL